MGQTLVGDNSANGLRCRSMPKDFLFRCHFIIPYGILSLGKHNIPNLVRIHQSVFTEYVRDLKGLAEGRRKKCFIGQKLVPLDNNEVYIQGAASWKRILNQNASSCSLNGVFQLLNSVFELVRFSLFNFQFTKMLTPRHYSFISKSIRGSKSNLQQGNCAEVNSLSPLSREVLLVLTALFHAMALHETMV